MSNSLNPQHHLHVSVTSVIRILEQSTLSKSKSMMEAFAVAYEEPLMWNDLCTCYVLQRTSRAKSHHEEVGGSSRASHWYVMSVTRSDARRVMTAFEVLLLSTATL